MSSDVQGRIDRTHWQAAPGTRSSLGAQIHPGLEADLEGEQRTQERVVVQVAVAR